MDIADAVPTKLLDDPWDESYGIYAPLPQFLQEEAHTTYRLSRTFRDAAATRDPLQLLGRAAEAFLFAMVLAQSTFDRDASIARGNAFADLAVTGRNAYAAFRSGVTAAAVEERLRALYSDANYYSQGYVTNAVNQALNRAYAVAWALRGPAQLRATLRPPLGWIAVSGEDDKPHRPVNVPAPPFEQYEVDVVCGGLQLPTRYLIASAEPTPATPATPQSRAVPAEPVPEIPPDHRVILFLHGHSSGADEAIGLIPELLRAGLERDAKYSVIAFDLPNNGYSASFDHTLVAPASATTFPRLPTDNDPIATPVLDFIENFVAAFVDAVDALVPIKDRIAAVIGGSLGGNLGLRLGRRDNVNGTTTDWLRNASIVAWSPASVWKPKVKNLVDGEAPKQCMDRCAEAEGVGTRALYFDVSFTREELKHVLKAQPEYWYRKDWAPRAMHIQQSKLARFEIYDANFRQWHWRVAGEQLIYSHIDNETNGDSTTPLRYTRNSVRMLLVACSGDNFLGTRIYDNTVKIGEALTALPGKLLKVHGTGHSIHFERPRYFAKQIARFLTQRSLRVDCIRLDAGNIISINATDMATGVQARMEMDECIEAIRNGEFLFVAGVDGSRTRVRIANSPALPYLGHPGGTSYNFFLRTVADATAVNNLESLPGCE